MFWIFTYNYFTDFDNVQYEYSRKYFDITKSFISYKILNLPSVFEVDSLGIFVVASLGSDRDGTGSSVLWLSLSASSTIGSSSTFLLSSFSEIFSSSVLDFSSFGTSSPTVSFFAESVNEFYNNLMNRNRMNENNLLKKKEIICRWKDFFYINLNFTDHNSNKIIQTRQFK